MATAALLVDACPAYLRSDREPASLLLAPLGEETLLEHVCARLAAAEADTLTIVPPPGSSPAYQNIIQPLVPHAAVVPAVRLGELLDTQEPSDWLLIVDVRFFPVAGFEFDRLQQAAPGQQAATHLVHVRHSTAGTEECIVYGREGHVRAIQRLYDGVTQLEVSGVSYSLVSTTVARYLDRPSLLRPGRLRTRLVAASVPTADLTTSNPVLDLTQEADLLALSERITTAALHRAVQPPFTELAPGVRAGPGCRVHPACHLFGPVVLHENVRIDANAAVIGPTVLGAGAHVADEAVVSHCLLGRGARAPRGSRVAHRVIPAGIHTNGRARNRAGAKWPPRALALSAVRTQSENGNGQQDQATAAGRAYRPAKWAFDFLIALGGLIILLPLFLLVALALKLTSRGPVFFGHAREGRNGRVFRCWKFRTMVHEAHRQQRQLYQHSVADGPQFVVPHDPRVTRLGKWLRATNIDELPQLFNVLVGDMSLIGPRPSPFRENQICVPWRNARLSVRPGITGLWQICRHARAGGDFHQWIYFDLLYVRHMSLGLDLRILLATGLTLGARWSVPLAWLIPSRKLRNGALPRAITIQFSGTNTRCFAGG